MSARHAVDGPARLPRDLGLFDVYAISTGAMFSSGFFLLPGVAAAVTGPSVVLAYLLAGLFILPAMLSVSELSTAMPRAGGAYYFLDRALGPVAGTVGGMGAWLGLVLKSAFALVGMGAYLALVVDLPIKPVALAFTVVFAVVNIIGAKETSGLQRLLVAVLVGILALFLVGGAARLGSDPTGVAGRFSPFLLLGFPGLMATVGMVFVSYAGLTKVASVAEEIRRPERNIPLGMALALATASVVYVVGVFVLVAVLDPVSFTGDLTPIASAADVVLRWLPGNAGPAAVVVAAVAAFASTGNAGILSASRYPLAMARDRLLPEGLARLGRFRTPDLGILVTAVATGGLILFLDVEGLAKLASAFTLLLFALLNLAVVVMRESGIDAYDPGFRSPFYPWVQILGMVTPFWLIAEMGELSLLFTLIVVTLSLAWYHFYARHRVERAGAIYHTFARLGRKRFEGLDVELRGLVREQGLRKGEAFDELVARAPVLDFRVPAPFPEVVELAARMLARRMGVAPELLASELLRQTESGLVPLAEGVALPHARIQGPARSHLLLARCPEGVRRAPNALPGPGSGTELRAILFVVSPLDRPGEHLRLLGHLAAHVETEGFLARWLGAVGEQQLKETLMRREYSLSVQVGANPESSDLVGRPLSDAGFPDATLVALIRRDGESLFPGGNTVLEAGDRITVIGDPDAIRRLSDRLGDTSGPTSGASGGRAAVAPAPTPPAC